MSISIPGFRNVARTGVIYVMHRAQEMGYTPHDASWINLGQGAPQTNELTDEPARITNLVIDAHQHEYSPVLGQLELRKKVAELYNTLYRANKKSQYTYENVSISGGGRIALTRLVAALGNINMGHFLPDYTAYEELLSIFKAFIPIPILLNASNYYEVSIDKIKEEILGRGLKALLMSNPCNPTGQLIQSERLAQWVNLAREYHCSFIMDEFYSHYIYNDDHHPGKTVSAAEFVDDVDRDPIIIVDGLTKNWRYPGWRISWTLAPKEVIHAVGSAGSFLDGGANNPLQFEAAKLICPNQMQQEAAILQQCFKEKRNYMLDRLKNMGIIVESPPCGAFYIWANLSDLPEPLNDGMAFFEAGLREKVITVPGIFFDVNPEKRRPYARYNQYCRISFGPDLASIEKGLDAIELIIDKHRVVQTNLKMATN